MLRKRIIFTLIYENGYFVQSRNFRLQKVGNINWLEKNYKFQEIAFSIDELVVLNATRNEKGLFDFASIVNRLVDDVFIPVAVGGGVRSLEDAELLFSNGADKIVINTILQENPSLVCELVRKYGTQSIVASIDYSGEEVFILDGQVKINKNLNEYIKHVESLNVGEIYLNSIEKDGTGFGFDINKIQEIANNLSTPLIMAGGAGNEKHLIEGLKIESVSAVATANLFNFVGDGLPNARLGAIEAGCNLARW